MGKAESEKRIEMTVGSQFKSDLDEVYSSVTPSPTPACGCLVVNIEVEGNTETLDKTWAEIEAVYSTGGNVVLHFSGSYEDYVQVLRVGYETTDTESDESATTSYWVISAENTSYETNAESGYPLHTGGGLAGGLV